MTDDTHYYEPARGHGLAHDPFNAIVGPRPIGWISTVDPEGRRNLAPYSFFNAFNYTPPIVGFSSIGAKDSLRNIEATGEFAWNLTTLPLAEAMNASCAAVGPEVDEFALAGLTPAPSRLIVPPRVGESPVAFECRLTQLIRLKTAEGPRGRQLDDLRRGCGGPHRPAAHRGRHLPDRGGRADPARGRAGRLFQDLGRPEVRHDAAALTAARVVQPVAPAAPPSGPRRRLAALRSCRPGPAAVLAATLVLAATIVAAQTVAESFATHSLLPQGDEWVSLAVFRSVMTGRTVVADMLGQHNEHRILFPRLVLFSDYLVAGGSGRLDLVAIFVTQALTCGLFLHLLAGGATRSPGRVAVGAVVVLLLASLRQSENFTWGFQVQFVGVFAAGSLAASLFAAAIGAARAGRAAGGRAALALAVAGIATFSMSNGLLVAPVLLALAVLGRAPRRMTIAAALATLGLAAAFFDGYEVLGSGSLRATLADDPLRIPAYAAAYLGNLLDPDMGACLLLGSAGLAWAALAALATATGRDRDPTRLALLGIMLFTSGSAALTALGRSGDGLGSAMASRYATGAACFWSAVLVHAWSSAGVLRRPRALQALVGAVGLVLVVGILKVQAPTVEVMRSLGVARTVGGRRPAARASSTTRRCAPSTTTPPRCARCCPSCASATSGCSPTPMRDGSAGPWRMPVRSGPSPARARSTWRARRSRPGPRRRHRSAARSVAARRERRPAGSSSPIPPVGLWGSARRIPAAAPGPATRRPRRARTSGPFSGSLRVACAGSARPACRLPSPGPEPPEGSRAASRDRAGVVPIGPAPIATAPAERVQRHGLDPGGDVHIGDLRAAVGLAAARIEAAAPEFRPGRHGGPHRETHALHLSLRPGAVLDAEAEPQMRGARHRKAEAARRDGGEVVAAQRSGRADGTGDLPPGPAQRPGLGQRPPLGARGRWRHDHGLERDGDGRAVEPPAERRAADLGRRDGGGGEVLCIAEREMGEAIRVVHEGREQESPGRDGRDEARSPG